MRSGRKWSGDDPSARLAEERRRDSDRKKRQAARRHLESVDRGVKRDKRKQYDEQQEDKKSQHRFSPGTVDEVAKLDHRLSMVSRRLAIISVSTSSRPVPSGDVEELLAGVVDLEGCVVDVELGVEQALQLKPTLRFAVAGRLASQIATRAMAIEPVSESMWPASARRARLPVSRPPITSATV